MTVRKPSPPGSLGPAGLELWRALSAAYVFDPHEVPALVSCCAAYDDIARLEALLEAGITSLGSTGRERLHPGVAELRLARLAGARLFAALCLPRKESELTSSQARAKHAAQVRWSAVRERRAAQVRRIEGLA